MIAFVILACFGAPDSVQASLDRSSASVGDSVTLNVLVGGTQARTPKIARVPGLKFYGPQTSRVRQNINGVVSETIGFRYTVVPNEPGKFTIPPISVRVGNQVQRSPALSLNVVDSDEDDTGLRPLFAVASVSNSSPFRSQQIVYSIQLYSELTNLSCSRFELPNFDKFIVEDLGEERRYQTVKGGRRYSVVEIRKSLFPVEAGRFTLPATELTCNVTYPSNQNHGSPFDRLFSRGRTETKVLHTEDVELNVKALPPSPPSFNNIVGKVVVGASIDTRIVEAGSSVTQALYVKSTGALRGLSPAQPVLNDVKIYDDQPKLSFNDRGQELETVIRMNRAFVPTLSGTVSIPGLSVSYFDPDTETYAVAETEPIELEITPNGQSEALERVSAKRSESSSSPAEPTEPVARENGNVPAPNVSETVLGAPTPPMWLALLAALFPPLAFLIARARKIRRPARSRNSLRRALARLDEQTAGDAETVERVIRDVLSRSNADELARCSDRELDVALEHRGVTERDRGALGAWLKWTESSRWGGRKTNPPSSHADLAELLTRVDRTIKA